MKAKLLKFTDPEFIRFVIIGLTNTGTTYVLYAGLSLALPYLFAYSISYVFGIFFSYFLNSKFVFREQLSFSKAVQYPIVYLVQYGLSVLLLKILVEFLGVDKLAAPFAIIILTIPVTFLLSRRIIKTKR